MTFIWKQHFFLVFDSPAFTLLPILIFSYSLWSNKLLSSGFLAFLPASSRWRLTALVLMWTPGCIKSFCKSKLVLCIHFAIYNGCWSRPISSVFRKRNNAVPLPRYDICHKKITDIPQCKTITIKTSCIIVHFNFEFWGSSTLDSHEHLPLVGPSWYTSFGGYYHLV